MHSKFKSATYSIQLSHEIDPNGFLKLQRGIGYTISKIAGLNGLQSEQVNKLQGWWEWNIKESVEVAWSRKWNIRILTLLVLMTCWQIRLCHSFSRSSHSTVQSSPTSSTTSCPSARRRATRTARPWPRCFWPASRPAITARRLSPSWSQRPRVPWVEPWACRRARRNTQGCSHSLVSRIRILRLSLLITTAFI